jgi:hypothetical protein
MSALDWLTHDKLQEILRRQEGIAMRLERGLPIPDGDLRWMAHTFGKLLFARVAEVLSEAQRGDVAARQAVLGAVIKAVVARRARHPAA